MAHTAANLIHSQISEKPMTQSMASPAAHVAYMELTMM